MLANPLMSLVSALLGVGVSESHTAGSERWVMCWESVLPVCASPLPCIPPPTGNGMRNAFPRVGKLESSSECWFPQGEGVHWLSPHDRRPSPTLEKKINDSSSGSHLKVNIKLTMEVKCMIFGTSRDMISTFVSINSHGFSFVF